MNMMPQPGLMGAPMPQITPEMIEEAKLIAEACTWEEISGVLRSDERRNYSIDIETTATAFEDDMEEKQQRTEFMGAMTQWLQVAMPAIQGNPTQAPLFKELTMFFMGGFKVGRTLEETFEDAFDQIKNMPPQPNPEAEAAKAEMAMKEKDLQMRMAESQQKAAQETQKSQQELAFKAQEQQLKQRGQEADLIYKQKELEFKERELAMKAQESEFNRQTQMEAAQFDRQSRQEEQSFKRDEAIATRAALNEDRLFQRQVAAEDIQGKRQDRELKTHETQTRLSMDQDEQKARRILEAEQMKGEGGKTARAEIEDSVSHQIQELASQFAASMNELSSNQVQIVSVLQEIKGNQDDVTDAVTKIAGHMTAPRKVTRDPKTGKATGFEVGQADGDLRTMLERLTAGGRQVKRDKAGRVEAFA